MDTIWVSFPRSSDPVRPNTGLANLGRGKRGEIIYNLYNRRLVGPEDAIIGYCMEYIYTKATGESIRVSEGQSIRSKVIIIYPYNIYVGNLNYSLQ